MECTVRLDMSKGQKWNHAKCNGICILPYSDKRKQLLKMKFLVNEQNVSVMYIGIDAISWCLDFNIFQQDKCFCSKLGLEVKHAKSNLKQLLSQIWVICHLLPFVRVGQYYPPPPSCYDGAWFQQTASNIHELSRYALSNTTSLSLFLLWRYARTRISKRVGACQKWLHIWHGWFI